MKAKRKTTMIVAALAAITSTSLFAATLLNQIGGKITALQTADRFYVDDVSNLTEDPVNGSGAYIEAGDLATQMWALLADSSVEESDLKAVDSASDEDILTYESTTGDFEWHSPAELKASMSLDNVENTALSTWAGTTNITILGTIATGVWSGTALLDAAVADTITIDQGQVVDIVGTDTIGADPAWQANAVGIGTTGIIFESAAADANEGLLVPAAIGGDRTWTLPNASGNILLTSNAATITNKTIDGDDNTIQDIGIFDHLYIPAGAFMTRTTAGATAVPNDEQWTTNDLNVDAYDFATAPPAQEGIQAQLKLPIGWDAGNLQAKVDYSHDGTAGTGVVRWNIALRAVNSDGSEAIDAAFGTAAEWNHTYDATPAGAMQTTAASGNFSDTSSDGDFLWIQIERDTDDAADTYTQAARFLGVHIQFERTLQTVSW
jgi:hypothetical protein